MPQPAERKIIFLSKPRPPSLFTLERARKRAVFYEPGHTHRIDDPYTAAERLPAFEPLKYEGKADHEKPFNKYVKMARSTTEKFIPSIISGKGGDNVTEDMFKPKLIARP